MFALILAAIVAQATPAPSPLPRFTPAPTATPSTTPAPITQKPLFVAPSGWRSVPFPKPTGTPGLRPFPVAMAIHGKSSVIVMGGRNSGLSLDDAVTMNVNALKRDGYTLVSSTQTTLCGRPAWIGSLKSQAGNFSDLALALNSSQLYVAAYAHKTHDDDAAGIAAIKTLCVPPDAVTQEAGVPPLTPPASWTALNMTNALAQFKNGESIWGWHGPIETDHAQVVMAFSLPTTSSANELTPATLGRALETGMASWAQNLALQSSDAINLCNSNKGHHFVYNATVAGRPMVLEMVTSMQAPRALTALYMRLATDKIDPAAQAAIRTLCPQGGQEIGYASAET